jgi:hypothetical protein
MKPLRAIALLAVLFPLTARAQIGVYAGFSGAHLNSTTVFGPLVGVYAQRGALLMLGGDVRGSFLNRNGQQFNTGAIGPRLALHPVGLPIKPYIEALVGIASYNTGNSSNATHLNYQILGGIDATLLPRLDWRVIEFDYSALAGSSLNATILTTGIVFRLP